jgi:hypothetical protein
MTSIASDLTAYVPTDDYFGAPFVDVDEPRDAPHPHRYVHGGFAGTETRFSFYFPPRERYEGRFFSSVEGGVGGHETRAATQQDDGLGSMGFAFSQGGYLVESNSGHIPTGAALSRGSQPGSVTSYRATAEVARYARFVAEHLYGELPHHGYIFGGSGGGHRSILSFENAPGIWDGAVPYISPAGIGVSFPCVVNNAARALAPDIDRVVAAFEPGGSGDPFAGLTSSQRRILAELYRSGFQPGAEFQLAQPAPELGVLLITGTMHRDFDPQYYVDFWNVPGYAGADGELAADVVDEDAVLQSFVTAAELVELYGSEADVVASAARRTDPATRVGFRCELTEPLRARGSDVTLADGRSLRCVGVLGDVLVIDFATGGSLADASEGDRAHIDNHHFLAYCHSYRHQVDVTALECGQFLVGGSPIHPQRELSLAEILTGVPSPAGAFAGKMIYVANLQDASASPLGGTITYANRVRGHGADAAGRLRVWLNDRAAHGPGTLRPHGSSPVPSTRVVDYTGAIEQAVYDVVAWVEHGIEPPADTGFDYDDGRVRLASAHARAGIQPVVAATVNGSDSTVVRAGEPVRLEASIVTPPGAGTVVGVEWDFDGRGTWPHAHTEIAGGFDREDVSVEHVYSEPGTYYAAVRAISHRDGALHAPTRRVPNLARVRVDVTA